MTSPQRPNRLQPRRTQPRDRRQARPRRRGNDGTIFETLTTLIVLAALVLAVAVGNGVVAVATVAAVLTPANLVTWLIAASFVCFAAFGIDKARAESGGWRVQESTLLLLALLGGTAGAYAGRALFRHKTSKQPFSNNLFAVLLLQLVGLGAGIGWYLI